MVRVVCVLDRRRLLRQGVGSLELIWFFSVRCGLTNPDCWLQSIVQQLAVMTEAASEGGAGGLEPEVDAAARRVRRLLRAKLEELKAVPLRGGGGGGGAGRPYNRASESSSGVHVKSSCTPPRRLPHDADASVCLGSDLATVVPTLLGSPTLPGWCLCFRKHRKRHCVHAVAGASSPQGSTASFGLAAMTIDDYEIIKPISRGAFGRVYLVSSPLSSSECFCTGASYRTAAACYGLPLRLMGDSHWCLCCHPLTQAWDSPRWSVSIAWF